MTANDDICVPAVSISKIALIKSRDVASLVMAELEESSAVTIEELGYPEVATASCKLVTHKGFNVEVSGTAALVEVRDFAPGALPGVLPFPSRELGNEQQRFSLRARNKRLVMTTDQGVADISLLSR